MFAFTNERSLEQHVDCAAALRFWYLAASEIAKEHQDAIFWNDDAFFATGEFKQRFNSLVVPKDEKAIFREMVFTDKYYKSWRPKRVSQVEDVFHCAAPVVSLQDESAGEAAEHSLRQSAGHILIFSAAASQFDGCNPLQITKQANQASAHLPNLTDIAAIKAWIAQQPQHFNAALNLPPTDLQTILGRDLQRFRYFGKVERRFKRRIYEEINTLKLFYVDHGHPGFSAHLEVFSHNYEHLGTADIATGQLDTSTRVAGRVLRL